MMISDETAMMTPNVKRKTIRAPMDAPESLAGPDRTRRFDTWLQTWRSHYWSERRLEDVIYKLFS
jgi:hypothetical protein